jgi:Tfp pilus assembly protein PilN
MIRVNLLPPEYRKVDGPPVGRVVALVVGAFLVASALGGWGYVHFGMLAEAENQRVQLEEELAQLKQQAERSQLLLREFTEYQRRRDTIEKIGTSRILWSRKLDEMADIIHNKGDQKEYLVWLAAVKTTTGRSAESPIGLQIQGLSGGTLANLSEFNKRIKDTREFFEDFTKVSPPAGQQKILDGKKYPNVAFDFSFEMDHKQPNWREKQGERQ